MHFEPLAPRLSAIPKSRLFTQDTVTELSSIVTELDGLAKKVRPLGAKCHIQIATLANNILSVANAVEDGDASIQIMQDLRHRMVSFDESIPEFESELAAAKRSKKSSRYTDEVASFSEALGKYSVDAPEPDTEEGQTALASDLQQALRNLGTRNRAIQKRLPRASAVDKYAIVKLPVLVLTGNRLDPKKLDKLGFEVSDFEGYPVIEDQLLLAVRTSYAKDWDMTTAEIADELLDTLSATTGTPLTLVSEQGSSVKASNGFMYYWIMPISYFNKLAPAMGELNNWSIAL